MRVPVEWLADYVAVEMGTEELARCLTMGGQKVESVERLGAGWDDVIIGEVVQLERHPTSEKPLQVAKVDLGGETITVVTGAQNVHLGARIPVIRVGGVIPRGPDNQPMVIRAKPMAGITSEGMLASARELCISDEHSGILILPSEAPVGELLRTIRGGDVLDVETKPNRPDTLCITGMAREAAALSRQQLTLPNVDVIDENVEWLDEESFPVRVEAADLCPRYSALRIEGVEVRSSPLWLSNRLEAAGMRSINLLVDLTNYVMLELGQPMHAFDAAELRGGRIVVRRAHEGEVLRTLDGVDRDLTPETLVIADGEHAVGVAGVMGGEESEITPDTTSIVLESANFHPISVRRTAQALGLRTESSSRSEKSLPAEQTVPALQRYLQLLAQITKRSLRAAQTTDVWVGPAAPRTVTMPIRDLHRLLGNPVSSTTAAEMLSLLGFEVDEEPQRIRAQVPFWRMVDIERSADLVEEVGRMIGFDSIPSTLPGGSVRPEPPLRELHWEVAVRERLLSAGVSEAVTHGLTSPAHMKRLLASAANGHEESPPERWAELVPNPAGVYEHQALTEPVPILNPATRDRQVLRLTLLPSLLEVVARNLKQTEEEIAFFEIDPTFFRRLSELPYERRTLAMALSGRAQPRTWRNSAPDPYSFYDVKGLVEAVLEVLRVKSWVVEAQAHPALHPGRSAVLRMQGHDIAYFGELHPRVAEAFDIDSCPVQVAEVDLDALFEVASDELIFKPLPKYPPVLRDIAVVVRQDLPAEDVVRVLRESGGELLESCEIFDVYAGEPLPRASKSIAVALQFRAPGTTLTQEEVSSHMVRIVDRLKEELGARLRD